LSNRVDVPMEDEIMPEHKSVDELRGIHEPQLLIYMTPAGIEQGFPIDFNVRCLKQDMKSFVLRSFVLFISFMVNRIGMRTRRLPEK